MMKPCGYSKRQSQQPERRRDLPSYSSRCCCVVALLLASQVATGTTSVLVATASATQQGGGGGSGSTSNSRGRFGFSLPGHRGFPEDEDDDDNNGLSVVGMGRELSLFDTTETDASQRGGDVPPLSSSGESVSGSSSSSSSKSNPTHPYSGYSLSSFQNQQQRRSGGSAGGRSSSYPKRLNKKSSFFQPAKDWWQSHISPNVKHWPKIQCICEPTTTLKIRKTFRPLKTVVRLGADFNTQLGVWQFKSSWEDEIIGGKLTLAGRELQLSKSWQLTGGGFGMEDLVTRLRLRAAVDLSTYKAYARVGFRTERLRPINVMEGLTIFKQVPLDGNKGHIKLQVKANVALPEPEIEYSTETQRSLVGMGDVMVNIEELNLLLDY